MNKGMKKHVMRAAACFVTGSMLVGSSSMAALAAGTSLVGVGSATVKEASVDNATEDTAETADVAEETTTEAAEDTATEDTTTDNTATEEAAAETEATQSSMVGTIAVAQPGDETFFYIRANADANSDVVGYLYDGNCATILGEEGDWYYVQSGDCTGYVAKYLLTTGEDAASVVEQVATPVAQVNAEALMVRTEPSEDADVVDTITADQIVYLEEDLGGWAKISTGTTEGYVSADYVSYATYLPQGESQEEAEARIAEEEAAYQAWLDEQERQYQEQLAAEQAEWEAQNQAWIEYLQSQSDYADQAQATADEAQAAADQAQATADQAAADQAYAEQVAADAQAALDEAYNTGDEETIANAEAYAQQTAADAQATADQAQQSADEAQAAQDQAQAAQDEAAAADQTVYDTVSDAGIDTSEVTNTTDDSSSTSSLRQQIVDYALQFVGNPYVYGGTSLTNGTDCSGFTQSVLANFGINISRTAGQQSQGGTSVDLNNLEPGDLLYYEGSGDYGIGHVTMYIGDGKVVHASSSSTGIIVSDVDYRTPVSASDYIGD